MRPHKNSLLHANQGETENPFYRSSPKWLCWEAISRTRAAGKTVLDTWSGRGCTVNIITAEDGRTVVEGLLG